jgi:predicted MPP superfamily phosphohydrolase
MTTRRNFLRVLGACAGAGAGVGFYTFEIEPGWLEIVRRPLPVRRLPPALIGRTVAHLSDIHIGPMVSDGYVIDTFRRVAALRPDIVVITGDLMSWCPGWRNQVATVYREVPRGRLATIASLGNHDYGAGWRDQAIGDSLADVLRSCGITVLRNQMLDVEGLQIVGLDDLWAKRFKPEQVLPNLDPGRAAIALSHNPDTADLPVWGKFEGWILAGHTHGGQCKPPFLPPPVLPVRNRRYTSGEFQLAGNRRLYISRGVGHSVPVRFNVRPEATLFDLEGTLDGGYLDRGHDL